MSNFHPKTIVAPVDYSPESLAALGTALDIADSPADVHVVRLIPAPDAARVSATCTKTDDEIPRQDTVGAWHRQPPDENYVELRIDLEVDDPAFRLVDFAQRISADLIVMPSHGGTGLDHMLLASVAERLVRLSRCPVLVLKR